MAFQSPYPAAKSNTSTSPPKIAATQFTREYLSSPYHVKRFWLSARYERCFTNGEDRTRWAAGEAEAL
jgi:hypothetical protein